MGRHKMCGSKKTCRLRDGHDGECDYGDTQVMDLRLQLAEMKGRSPEELQARTEAAEATARQIQGAVLGMAEGCRAGGFLVLEAQLMALPGVKALHEEQIRILAQREQTSLQEGSPSDPGAEAPAGEGESPASESDVPGQHHAKTDL